MSRVPSRLNAPPHTQSVYLLTSTTMDDVEFKDTAAQSQVLVGLPQVRDVEAVQRFCDAHGPSLTNVHHVVLPGDVNPVQSLLIRTLLRHLPQARLACNEFGHALLTNPAFHDGVRRAVLENAPNTPLDIMGFAELPASRVSSVQDGDAIAVDVRKDDDSNATTAALPARKLRVIAVKSDVQEQHRKANGQTHHPAYFTNQPLFLYDDVFYALFTGHTLHRLPWLPSVVKEAPRELVLPMPPSLALQHPMRRPNVLLDTWRVDETSAAVVTALRRTPAVERVLSNSYGELSGSVEDCIAQVENSTDALERLRSRLAQRLASDTSRDVHRWSTALLRRVVQEVICVRKVSEPTAPAEQEQFIEWAQKDGEWGRLATCLTHSAMVLAPTVNPATAAEASKPSSAAASREGETAPPLEGSSGVDLLVAIFEKKGLQGLTRTVRRETIDVQVFLTMSESDLKAVFKATFGITKRLGLLQDELRKNL
ncbi:putative mitochondrial hypothetical protein [Leptomonas pyrrhocoris]|uniref:Uncharacterized protein n=1 Tax=Leptomonas pyrrhocoris TaxID=157538 RepID=A0A0M9G5V2_LEPPY|nr:putative mitochondrial hypothetical protein [Leptomonas pyrrhocoris]KPA82983.1 putative mitochondrial hypothetical protein [Leptomonas pyrrhocoris]|eukprot:XP_015661422.1 putative mitochondrial hypothetical protein [Leptomonas pyrrhocoris]